MKLSFGLGSAVWASITACGGIAAVSYDASGPDASTSDGAPTSCVTDGGEALPQPSFSWPYGYGPGEVSSFAVDSTGVYAAWRSSAAGDGGYFAGIYRDTTELVELTPEFSSGLAIDATSVFWGENTSIRSVPKMGGPANTMSVSPQTPFEVRVDDTNVYWTTSDGAISKMPKTGGQVTVLIAPSKGYARNLRVTHTAVYALLDNRGIVSVPINGGPVGVVAGNGGVFDIDATYLYYLDQTEIWKLPLAGGLAQSLGRTLPLSGAHSLATDGVHLYLPTFGIMCSGATIWRIGVDGSSPGALFTSTPNDESHCFQTLVVQAAWVYAQFSRVERYCK